jgi:hypothetical protein
MDPSDLEESVFLEQALLALDGLLDADGLAALKAELAVDASKRRRFVRLCLQSQALSEAFALHGQDELLDLSCDVEAAHSPGGDGWGDREFMRNDGSPWKTGGRSRWTRRPWVRVAAACAAGLLALVAYGAILWRRPGAAQLQLPAVVVGENRGRPASGDVRHTADFDSLAMMIKLEKAVWAMSDGAPSAEGDVLAARRLRLRSGRATLAFLSGVMLTLEGPVDVDLVSIDRVFCRRGRLRARVPKGAEGFVVASPGSAVVDMGTEFALNVEPDGRARVMVFEGAAEAALLNTAGEPERFQLVERSKAFDLNPGTRSIAESDAGPEGFAHAPEFVVPRLDLDSSYVAAVMESQPKAYWRFESISAGAVPNEVPGGLPLRVNGPVSISGPAPGHGCAVFRADSPEQFLFTDELWAMPRAPGHAVEFWFLAEGISYASLVGFFPPKDYLTLGQHGRHIHTFHVELTARDRQSLFKPASVRFMHRWPLDTRIGNNIFSDDVYIPRRWHHVLAQKNCDRLDLFFDGVLHQSTPLEPDHPDRSCRLVVGRRSPDPRELNDSRSFVGRLDELAFYDHPLMPEQVRRHYQLAAPAERSR